MLQSILMLQEKYAMSSIITMLLLILGLMQPMLSSGVIFGQIPFIQIQSQNSSSSLSSSMVHNAVNGSDNYFNSSSNDLTDLTRLTLLMLMTRRVMILEVAIVGPILAVL